MSRGISTIQSSASLPADCTPGALIAETDLSGNAWIKIVFELSITNNAAATVQGREVILCYAFSNTDLTSTLSTAPVTLGASCSYFHVKVNGQASAVQIATSPSIDVGGNYLYTWFIIRDPLGQAVTVTLKVLDNS